MLRVTADVFSGRPNPTWVLDETEAADILKDVALNKGILQNAEHGFDGLGFRGLDLEFLSDHDAEAHGLPHAFRIAHGASTHEAKAIEIADRLFAGMLNTAHVQALGSSLPTPLDAALQGHLQELLGWAPRPGLHSAPDVEESAAAKAAAACWIETGRFNPAFWNTDPNVMRNNNCYNYASNKRTNTFAQPGRGSGHMYTAITCPAVSAAARSDGLHDPAQCLPDSEKPRWYVALVVAPGPGFVDYHWYRKHTEGFWGHKPGGTAARNVDNAGHVILDPRNANRGPYTQFCGFFYVPKSQRIS